MHPLGTKQKIPQSLGGKNYATSRDKKITEPLGTKKNHKTSRGKKNFWNKKKPCNLSEQTKIPQYLGTNKITKPFGTKKSRNPLREKKIMPPLGPANQKK